MDPEKLGVTHPHEHIFLDISVWIDPKAPKRLLKAPMSMDILADLKRKDGQNRDNMVLESFDDAVSELLRFKKAGGRSIVELTLPGIGRDVVRLREISKATGLNVVCGTGFYIAESHPGFVKKMSIDELAEIMISEVEEGIEGTGIRAGVIGEIGCGEPLHPQEAKVIAAAARAQARTGLGLTLHTALFDVRRRRAPKQVRQEVEILQRNGADLSKVYISHMDFTCDDLKYHEALMDEFGITLSYDTFGAEQYFDNIYFGAAGVTDRERCRSIAHLVKRGFAKQLLVSSDVCEKIHLRKYGGFGYANILENAVPSLRLLGLSERDVATMMRDNPRRILSR
jgi:phosphotriesterase-related protein